jgi:hypothetical protein
MRQRAVEMLRFALAPPHPRTPGGAGGDGEGGDGEAGPDDEAGEGDGDDEEPRQGRAARIVVH